MNENKAITLKKNDIPTPPDINQKSFLAKHKIIFIVLVLLFFFIIVPFSSFFIFLSALIGSSSTYPSQNILSGSGQDKIAVLNIDGEIVEENSSGGIGGLSSTTTSAQQISQTLHNLESDPSIKVLVLRVDSPGGSAAASDEIYHSLLNYKKKTGNKIVAYFSDMAASGGYFVSMASDKIVANPATITGSIGVIVEYLNFGDLANKYGVKEIVYKSGPHKDIISQFRMPTDQEQTIMQSIVNDVFNTFVQAVSQGRHMSDSKVRSLADGRVYSAEQAKQDGLVDEVGTFDQAVSTAKSIAHLNQATVVEYGQSGFLSFLTGGLMQKINLELIPGIGNLSALSLLNANQNSAQVLYMYQP